ncbi:MAG TPA: cytochrome P450 [Candidatus Limnocylindrales bacterium]|nr:cytochrome P450 [Candidatus Limnocylindrales bacterium]
MSFPFTQPDAYQPEALARNYDALHSSGVSSLREQTTGLYAIWKYDDVEQILKGADDSVSNKTTLNPLTPMARFAANPAAWPSLAHLVTVPAATANAHGQQHEEVRRAVFAQGGLSLRLDATTLAFGELIARRAQAAADDLASRGGATNDFAAVFARPLAAGVISAIVGFGAQDEWRVQQWSDAQTALLGRPLDRRGQKVGVRGLSDLSRACRALAKARAASPASDLASHLLAHGLDVRRAGATLMNIMAAGYSTSYGTLLNSMRFLLSAEGRSWWDGLAHEDSLPDLVTELIRVETGLIGWKRLAAKDVRLSDGTLIPAGSQMLLMLGAANRDPDRFTEPHRIRRDRAERKEPKPLTFGTGPHLCLGREVARAEISVALSVLRHRFPGMVLQPPTGWFRYDPDYLFRTPVSLPVRVHGED